MNALIQRFLGGAVVLLMLLGFGLTVYSVHEHRAAATALDGQTKALAAAAVSASEAKAAQAALSSLVAGQAKAKATQAAAQGRLQAAINSNSPAMSTDVPETVWESIFGADDAK